MGPEAMADRVATPAKTTSKRRQTIGSAYESYIPSPKVTALRA